MANPNILKINVDDDTPYPVTSLTNSGTTDKGRLDGSLYLSAIKKFRKLLTQNFLAQFIGDQFDFFNCDIIYFNYQNINIF